MSPLQRLEADAHQAYVAERRLHAERAWRYRLRLLEQDDLLTEELALPDEWTGFSEAELRGRAA